MQYQDCATAAQADEPDTEKAYVYGPVPFGLELANANININPLTGLATDYLNHFNEAIMLLEMAGHGADCLAAIRRWQPMSYRERLLESRLKAGDLAIAGYSGAEPAARACLAQAAGHARRRGDQRQDRYGRDRRPAGDRRPINAAPLSAPTGKTASR